MKKIKRFNQKLYESIMTKISRVVKQKLNEADFNNAAYDRWKTSTPYDDEEDINGVIELDIKDILYNNDEIDDMEFANDILNQLGIPTDDISDDDIIILDTDGTNILNPEVIDELLDQIDDDEDRDIVNNLIWNQIDRDIKNDNINWEYYQQTSEYDDDRRDYYKEKEFLDELD